MSTVNWSRTSLIEAELRRYPCACACARSPVESDNEIAPMIVPKIIRANRASMSVKPARLLGAIGAAPRGRAAGRRRAVDQTGLDILRHRGIDVGYELSHPRPVGRSPHHLERDQKQVRILCGLNVLVPDRKSTRLNSSHS